MPRRPRPAARKPLPTTTLGPRRVNILDLYELCVQHPSMEAAFIRAVHGRAPVILGEDFCGPASVARAWCAHAPQLRAAAIDRDPVALEHARRRVAEHDRDAAAPIMPRMKLVCRDVRQAAERADAVCAFNFALCELHTRADLMAYLRSVRRRLRANGVLVADLYAGSEQFTPGIYRKRVRTPGGAVVEYTWEQRSADPFSAMVVNAIHFKLPGAGGQRARTLRDAFVYRWRLWSIAELREAMREAGFRTTEVHTSYGEGIDQYGELYVSPAVADNQADGARGHEANMVAYVVGRK